MIYGGKGEKNVGMWSGPITVMTHTCDCRGDTRIIAGKTPSICQISRQSIHSEEPCYMCICGQTQQGDKEHKVIFFLEVIRQICTHLLNHLVSHH